MTTLLLMFLAGLFINRLIMLNIFKLTIADYRRLQGKVILYSSVCGFIIGRIFSSLIEALTGWSFEVIYFSIYIGIVFFSTFSIIKYYKRFS